MEPVPGIGNEVQLGIVAGAIWIVAIRDKMLQTSAIFGRPAIALLGHDDAKVRI